MDVQTSLFWITGVAFFAVQLGILLLLMRQGRSPDAETAAYGRLEIVWTLVPASLIAALALMLGGFTRGSWTDPEQRPTAAPGLSLRWTGPEDGSTEEPRR